MPQAERRVLALCAAGLPERDLREAVLEELRPVVPFDFHVWALTDPETAVGTAPLATTPERADLPRLIRAKYLTPVNRWTRLADVAALGATPGRSLLWREVLADLGIDDVASVVLRDRHGCWSFLDLWRVGGRFTPTELAQLASVRGPLTGAVRAALLATFTPAPEPGPAGPVVLLLDGELRPVSSTPGADAHLRTLLPTPADRSPVPAAALNAAAQLLAVEAGVDDHPPYARLHLAGGRWIGVRAARLGPAGPAAFAVTLEALAPAERLAVFARAAGLTPREHELLGRLAAGADTRGAARALGIAESTVNDHLKAIFTKTGTHGRREVLARATG